MNVIETSGISAAKTPIQKVLRIRPVKPWAVVDFLELWDYRDLLYTLAIRDLKLRYRQTALGVLWVLFQPLAGAGVFSIVFGRVAGFSSNGYSYFVYSLSGLLVWNVFQSILAKSSVALLANGALVSKVYFPRLLLPLSTILSSFVDFIIGGVVFIVAAYLSDWRPGSSIVEFPFWLLAAVMLAVGCGLVAASLMARFRDVQHVLPMLLPFLMYATPVAYGMNVVPVAYRELFYFNPMSWVVEGARYAVFGGVKVPFVWLVYTAIVSLLCVVCGVVCFRKMERSLADVL